MLRVAVALALASAVGACALGGGPDDEVEAVVLDERARQAAASVARSGGEPDEALDAAEDAAQTTPP